MPKPAIAKETSATQALFRIHIRGALQDVWDEITRTDDVIPCFFNMRMHAARLARGAPMQMRTKSGKYVGVVGEILEWDPPRRFAHTFRFTQMDDPPCKVSYELVPKDDGVEFTLRISELTPGTKSAKQMTQGAVMILNTLKAVIETGRPTLGTRALFALFALLEPLTPKRCRVENWSDN
ncbi:MAG TPA: SRPBCC domain-containing protein [Planctomycetota bacterium]